MSGWRNFRTHKSDSFGYKLKRWFHNKSQKMGKENFHFTTRMLMEELELDYENYGERTKVNNFIYNERKDFSRALTTFLQSNEYLEKKEAGKGEKELFDAMVDAALSRNIYPVFCDHAEVSHSPCQRNCTSPGIE